MCGIRVISYNLFIIDNLKDIKWFKKLLVYLQMLGE